MIVKVRNDQIISIMNEVEYQNGGEYNIYKVDCPLDITQPFSSQVDVSKLETISELELTDLSIVRVIEDLADLLISKNIITFQDLPDKVREKLITRKQLRSKLRE